MVTVVPRWCLLLLGASPKNFCEDTVPLDLEQNVPYLQTKQDAVLTNDIWYG